MGSFAALAHIALVVTLEVNRTFQIKGVTVKQSAAIAHVLILLELLDRRQSDALIDRFSAIQVVQVEWSRLGDAALSVWHSLHTRSGSRKADTVWVVLLGTVLSVEQVEAARLFVDVGAACTHVLAIILIHQLGSLRVCKGPAQ